MSRINVTLRPPTGAEDILLDEAPIEDPNLALELVARLAAPVEHIAMDWESLVVTDLEALILHLRRLVFGDLLNAEVTCAVPDCGARIDVSFRLSEYLAFHAPRPAHRVDTHDGGWYHLRNTDVTFRLPTVLDQLMVTGSSHPRRELVRRCIRPADVPAATVRRIERAMEMLAPQLSRTLQGICPECDTLVDIAFDAIGFPLRELCDQAAYIYADVHLIASHYHWPEADILALPRVRRNQYAELARAERLVG